MKEFMDISKIKERKKELSRLREILRDYRKRIKNVKKQETKEAYYIKYLKVKVEMKKLQDEIYLMELIKIDSEGD